MGAVASQMTSLTIVDSAVYSGADQNSASLAFVTVIHRWLVTSQHKGPVKRKMCSFDDVIMEYMHSEFCEDDTENVDSVRWNF